MFATVQDAKWAQRPESMKANDSAVIKTTEIFRVWQPWKMSGRKNWFKIHKFPVRDSAPFLVILIHRIKRNRWDTWPPTTPMIECEWEKWKQNFIYRFLFWKRKNLVDGQHWASILCLNKSFSFLRPSQIEIWASCCSTTCTNPVTPSLPPLFGWIKPKSFGCEFGWPAGHLSLKRVDQIITFINQCVGMLFDFFKWNFVFSLNFLEWI